jgi:hypothetical protein
MSAAYLWWLVKSLHRDYEIDCECTLLFRPVMWESCVRESESIRMVTDIHNRRLLIPEHHFDLLMPVDRVARLDLHE